MPTRNSQAAYWGGGGQIVVVTVPDPAAGADWSTAVPADRRWRLRVIRFRIVTDANVAARAVNLDFDDAAGNELLRLGSQATQPAGIGRQYYWSDINLLQPIITNGTQQSLPSNLVLAEGFTVSTFTGAIQVGDQISAIRLWVEEWIAIP